MQEGISNGIANAADVVMKWRAHDMLDVIVGLAPLFGIRPSSKMQAYSRTQLLQLSEVTKDAPSLFLQVIDL